MEKIIGLDYQGILVHAGAATHDRDDCERMCRLAQGPRVNEANDIFAGHLHRYSNAWFTFLLDPDRIPATNCPAEQALRTPIVDRKVFGGNRADPGCKSPVRRFKPASSKIVRLLHSFATSSAAWFRASSAS